MARLAIVLGLLATLSGAFYFSAKQAYGAHFAISIAALAAAIWFAIRNATAPAWAALASLAIAGITGWLLPTAEVWHAIFAHLFIGFAAMTIVPDRKLDPIDLGPWKAIRPAAQIAPFAVFAQIGMGAMYRHQITDIIPHMLGAIIVALLTLVAAVVILQHFNQRRELKDAASSLIGAVLLQILLGITTFIMQLLEANTHPVFAWIAAAHVTVGSMVLAASIVVAMEIRKNFQGGRASARAEL